LPDVISENLSLDAGPHTPAVHRVLAPVSSTMSSAFPMDRSGRLPAFILRTTSRRASFRGCRYFVMFRPPSLLAPRIVPTAANTAAGQLGLLRPGLSCVVAAARPGYANRPNTGNWRYGDLHPARLSALSAAPLPGMGRFGTDDELDTHPLVRWQIVDELAARSATVGAVVVVLTADLQLQWRARPLGAHCRCERRSGKEERTHGIMCGVCSK